MIIEGKEYEIRLKGETYHCALDVTMHFIGGKWKTVVLWYLRNGRKRFSELKRHIPDITEKMLSLQLKQLEADGFIGKTIYPEVPPRVEYFLTEAGKTLLPVLEVLARWGREKGDAEGEVVEEKGFRQGREKSGCQVRRMPHRSTAVVSGVTGVVAGVRPCSPGSDTLGSRGNTYLPNSLHSSSFNFRFPALCTSVVVLLFRLLSSVVKVGL